MEKKKITQEFQIIELFLVKAGNDYSRTFIAQIRRESTKEGKSIIRGNVMVNDGQIWSMAGTQEELGKYLDDLCVMKLDMGLHSHYGVSTEIFGSKYFLN